MVGWTDVAHIQSITESVCLLVGWLLNVPATG